MTGDPRTIPAAQDRFADRLPGQDALITEDRSFTAAALRDEVHRAAAALIGLGVQPGDRVAIWSPNTWHWVVACLAIHHAGAAMVPLNTRYTASEASDILARTEAPVLFGMGRFPGNDRVADLDRDALPALRHVLRIPIEGADGTWDDFMAGGADTSAVAARAAAVAIDVDGWLHTGGVGEVDEHGNLRITDRLKDMYICGGFNVYPAEIEQVLARMDGVADAAVIGVPDPRLGEVGRAFVVPRPGSELDEESVIAYTREHLANFKAPRSVRFVDALPRNAGGKVVKPQLRELA